MNAIARSILETRLEHARRQVEYLKGEEAKLLETVTERQEERAKYAEMVAALEEALTGGDSLRILTPNGVPVAEALESALRQPARGPQEERA